MFQRSPGFLCSFVKSSSVLLFHHHSHRRQPQRQRQEQNVPRRNRTQTTFADAEEYQTTTSSSSSMMIQPSKFFTSDLVQQHQRNVSSSPPLPQTVQLIEETNSLFDNDESGTFRKYQHESQVDDMNDMTTRQVPRGFESRGQQPHTKARLLTESRNPLDTLPSARLLKKMNYFQALKATQIDELKEDDLERHASSKEAATVRLQAHAHHDKLMFRQRSSGAEKEDPHKAYQKPMFRCQRCFHMFKFAPRRVGKNSLDETRAIQNGFAKDKLFFELEAKYKKRGVIVGSRSLSADPTRVNEATCPKCGSGKTESLMQYLHVRNNVRKT